MEYIEYYYQACKTNTSIVPDHSARDSLCSECGLILNPYYIDKVSERPIFSDDDPSHVHGPSKPTLIDYDLLTAISKPKDAKACNLLTPKWWTHVYKTLIKSLKTIDIMANKLSLAITVKVCTKEI